MKSPSQTLSGSIIDRLVSAKLLTSAEGKKLLPKLADGKLQTEDWRLAVELSTEKKEAGHEPKRR